MKLLLMYQPSQSHLDCLRSIAPTATIAIATSEIQAKIEIVDADVVFGNRFFLQSLPHAKKLRWMQSNSMGVDKILHGAPDILDTITLSCSRGIYVDEVAEHAIALLFGISRGLHLAFNAFQQRHWGRWHLPTLQGSSCLLLGWGSIGQAIAKRLIPLGISVTAVRRTLHEDTDPQFVNVTHLNPSQWRSKLPLFQSLIVALPLTAETTGLLRKPDFYSLPKDAIFVNIGRGKIIHEAELCEVLHQGHLLGAGLDTIHQEPPAEDNPIWTTPRLILTPHVARSLEVGEPKWTKLFEENLKRFIANRPLLNVVDPQSKY